MSAEAPCTSVPALLRTNERHLLVLPGGLLLALPLPFYILPVGFRLRSVTAIESALISASQFSPPVNQPVSVILAPSSM